MNLLDLEPHWLVLEQGGPRVGLTFLCPHCRTQRLAICFHHHGQEVIEDSYILAHHGANDTQHIWDLEGQDDFATLTLTPSIDASSSGHWHGLISGGEIR
jgi:hypothetical protein